LSQVEAVERELGFLDHVPMGVFVLREDFVVLLWNYCLQEWTGISQEEVVGKHVEVVLPHLSAPPYAVRLRNVFAGGLPLVFSSQLHPRLIPTSPGEGRVRVQYTTVTPVPAPDGMSFYALFAVRDVTERARCVEVCRAMRAQALEEAQERKKVEAALRRRNLELSLLNKASQALTSTLDLDQVLAAVLEEVRRLLGVIACSIWLVDPETDELVCQQSIGPQSEIVRGWRLAPGEGFVGWVARTGESLVAPDTWTDERHFKGVDRQTGLLMRSILTVPLRVKRGVIGVLQVMDTEPDRFDETYLTLLEPLATSAAIAIDNARLVETLRRQTAELEVRNEELDAFSHTAAHDLKGPLGYMVGFAKVLAEDYSALADEEVRRYLRLIVQGGQKMSNIIDSLLLLSSVRQAAEVKLEPLDMGHIVEEARHRLAYMIEEHQAEIISPPTWPVALGYGPWVEEVWVNYLSNAIKYGGEPARVELGAEPADGDEVRFWVRDNGPGIPPEDQARLFVSFTRLDQVRAKGHGLGLSIVRRIVEKLGGRVGVESEVGQGSVFSFTLPAVARDEATGKATDKTGEGAS